MAKFLRCFFGPRIYPDRSISSEKYTTEDLETCSNELDQITRELGLVVKGKYKGNFDTSTYDPADRNKVKGLLGKRKALETKINQISQILTNSIATRATLENLELTNELAHQTRLNSQILQNAISKIDPHQIAHESDEYQERMSNAQDMIQLTQPSEIDNARKDFEITEELDKLFKDDTLLPNQEPEPHPTEPKTTKKNRPNPPITILEEQHQQKPSHQHSSAHQYRTKDASSTSQKKPAKKPVIPLSQ